MATSESSDSPQVKLIREWSQGFQKKDLGILATALHKDFRQVTYPRSLNQPDKTKEEWLGHIAGVISLWTDVEASYLAAARTPPPAAKSLSQETIHSVIDAPGKVVAHVRIPNVEIDTAATQRRAHSTVD